MMFNTASKNIVQPKLRIGPVNDQYEKEADAVADQVMRMPPSPPPIQRKCEECEEEQLQMKPLQKSITPIIQKQSEEEEEMLHMKSVDSGYIQTKSTESSSEISSQLNQTKGTGSKLPGETNQYMSRAFGTDFGGVNVHTGSDAIQMNRSLNARAFTHGNDIYFNQGEFNPKEGDGKHLLAHELTHVVQQGEASNVIQRTTHGPSTPTNCHNWRIPLPPWTAGSIAHGQISAMLGVLPHSIPRATKLLMGVPNPPAITPFGFPDLWRTSPSGTAVGEIKSTYTGSTIAQAQALHYKTRHDECLARGAAGTADPADAAYLAASGGLPGSLIDLSSTTGTDLNLGIFWGDPLKQLHVEADALGAMVYWCTGAGLPFNPLWYPVFRDVMNELKRLLEEAARMLRGIGERLAEGLEWIADNAVPIFVFLLLLAIVVTLVLAIICLIAAPGTGGLSLVCSYLGIVGMVEATAALLLILGINIGEDTPTAAADTYAALNPDSGRVETASGSDYERGTEDGNFPSSRGEAQTVASQVNPPDRLIASLRPLGAQFSDPLTLIRTVSGNMTSIPAGGVDQLNIAARAIENGGDAETANYIRRMIEEHDLA